MIINPHEQPPKPATKPETTDKKETAAPGDIEDALTREIVRATGKAPCKGCGR